MSMFRFLLSIGLYSYLREMVCFCNTLIWGVYAGGGELFLLSVLNPELQHVVILVLTRKADVARILRIIFALAGVG